MNKRTLSAAANTPNYGLVVLHLVAEPSVDEQVRRCAAINFKKHIQSRWMLTSDFLIQDGEKQNIKNLMVSTILSATTEIQAQLSEALAVICNHDFDLLPKLRSILETFFFQKNIFKMVSMAVIFYSE